MISETSRAFENFTNERWRTDSVSGSGRYQFCILSDNAIPDCRTANFLCSLCVCVQCSLPGWGGSQTQKRGSRDADSHDRKRTTKRFAKIFTNVRTVHGGAPSNETHRSRNCGKLFEKRQWDRTNIGVRIINR